MNKFEILYSIQHWWRGTIFYRAYLHMLYRVVPKHRYHLIETGMKPGYADISVRMEAALSKLVIDFVEKEKHPDSEDYEHSLDTVIEFWQTCTDFSEEYRNQRVEKEIAFKDLYIWCKKWHSTLTYEEDVFYDEEAKWYDHPGRKEFDAEVDKRMIQIVEFRNWMWT